MTPITEITMRPSGRQEEVVMHLFDAETKEEVTLCGADASVHDWITVQYYLRQLIDGIHVGNVCLTCMGFAAWRAEGHCRKMEPEAILLRARAKRLHERHKALSKQSGGGESAGR